MENHNQPAFPPQVAQDNLGRIIAPIPGMSKLEFYSIMLLPVYIDLERKTDGIRINGSKVTPFQAAIYAAEIMIELLNKSKNEKDTLQIIE